MSLICDGNSEEVYSRDANLKPDDVKTLHEWWNKQPHTPKITEFQAILFLHSCFYRIEAAKVCLENFCVIRNLCPSIFDSEPQEELRSVMAVASVLLLPKPTPEGYSILLFKISDPDPSRFSFANSIRLAMLYSFLYTHQKGPFDGYIILFDMLGTTLNHLAGANLNMLKYAFLFLQEGAPVRTKSIQFINMTPMTNVMMNMIKPFLKKELADMIQGHPKSIETLYKFIPKECLPSDCGGVLPDTRTLFEEAQKNFWDNWEFFKVLDKMKIDETKRVGPVTDFDKIFGMDGTFKKLQFD